MTPDPPARDDQTLLTQGLKTDRTEAIPPASRSVVLIPGHVVEMELGRGGMGVVYKARHERLGRTVAVKMILHGEHADEEDRRRFLDEARTLAQLEHENIVRVHEVGEHDGKPFFSLEYVEGGSLDRLLREGPLSPQTAAALVGKLARAMHTAHGAGIIHRDLKPANILLQEGLSQRRKDAKEDQEEPSSQRSSFASLRLCESPSLVPKITDFGLARNVKEQGKTRSGTILGTPSYMAPEQASGNVHAIDARTDVYALGAILYECLTGRPPFRAATALDTVLQVLHEESVRVRQLQPGAPLDLETICHKCLEKEPARRYASAAELADDLGRFLRAEPVTARPVGRLERAWRWSSRNKTVAALLAAVVVALLAGTGFSTWFGLDARAQRDESERQRLAAEAAREQAEQARERAEERLYLGQVAHVHRALQQQLPVLAQDHFDQLARGRGSWERGYLHRVLNQEQHTFLGHEGPVRCVAFCPDGRLIASGGWDHKVKLWDAQTGRELPSPGGHQGIVGDVAFSPDGKLLVSVGHDDKLHIWNPLNGQHVSSLSVAGGVHGVTGCLAFNRDGRLACNNRGDVVVLDPNTGQELRRIGTGGRTWDLAFSNDGKLLVTGGPDGVVQLWDADIGNKLRSLSDHLHPLQAVAFSPDGQRIASGDKDGIVKLWDAKDGKLLHSLQRQAGEIWSLAFSPDGRWLASSSSSLEGRGRIRLWHAATGRMVRTFKGHTGFAYSIAFSPDGRRLVSGGKDGSVRLWDVLSGAETYPADNAAAIACLSFSPRGDRLAAGREDGGISLWDAATGETLAELRGHRNVVSGLCFSPDGERLFSASYDRSLKEWEVGSGRVLRALAGSRPFRALACTPDGKCLVSADPETVVEGWDLEAGAAGGASRRKEQFQSVSAHKAFALSADGTRFGLGTSDGTVKVSEPGKDRFLLHRQAHLKGVSSLAFSPDGRWLASGGEDQVVYLWNLDHPGEPARLRGHTGAVRALAFSADSKRLFSGGDDRLLKMWDVATLQELMSLDNHSAGIRCLASDPTGRRLASVDAGRKVLLHDSGTETPPAVRQTLLERWARPDPDWHTEQATECEREGNWFGVLFHVRAALPARAWNATLHLQLARALANLGQREQAALRFVSAALLNPALLRR